MTRLALFGKGPIRIWIGTSTITTELYRVLPRFRREYSGIEHRSDRLYGLVVKVLGYRSGGPCSIPCTTKKKVCLERDSLSLVSTTEKLLDRKVAAPV
jgi:hypothetical protein